MSLSALARWCHRNRRIVVVAWAVAFVVLNVVGKVAGDAYSNNFSGGHSDSTAAFDLLKERFPARAGDTAQVVFAPVSGNVQDPAVHTAVDTLIAAVKGAPYVVAVDSPYDAPAAVSRDGRVAYVTVTYDKQAGDLPAKAGQPVIDAMKQVRKPGLRVEANGYVVARAVQAPMGATEGIGLLAAVIILFIAFGSLLAMSLPIIAAVCGVGIGLVFVVLISHAITVPSFAPYVAVMIGLGVGIDYALFIVVRYRSGLHDGHDPEGATVVALATAGRAVLFAGCTVIISLLGLMLMGINFIYGLSICAISAVLMTMLASVTLVPAIIGFAGTKLAEREHKRRHHRDTVAFRWSRQIQRRPVVMAAVALVVLVVTAIPMFSIHLGVADQGNDPTSLTTRKAYDLLAGGFGPGTNGPIILAADLHGSTTLGGVEQLAGLLRADPDVAYVAPTDVNAAGNAASVAVIPKGSPQDRSTEQLVHRIRTHIKTAGLGVHVGSVTAIAIDASDHIGRRLPVMVAAVIVLSFLLLLAVFRSVLVAVKAAVMNLLSIGAAYGVIVAIFQWGWLKDVIDIGRPGPIENWVPMMLFTVLFGLSMDYEVFLLSRVREEYLISGDNGAAVADGLATTARVITAAAAIMIAVFLSFVLGDQRVLKLLGLGLATAIFVDATIVRMVLVPATMELLGKANWWLPGWLDRLIPKISVEAPLELAAPAADPAPAR